MTDKWTFFILGVVATLLVNLILDSVRRWREMEKARIEVRAVVGMLISEMAQRIAILNNNVKENSEPPLMDQVYIENWSSSGKTFDYKNQLLSRRHGFDAFVKYLPDLRKNVTLGVVQHYQGMDSDINKFVDLLSPPNADGKALDKLTQIRVASMKVMHNLNEEYQSLPPRNFCSWFLSWVQGKA